MSIAARRRTLAQSAPDKRRTARFAGSAQVLVTTMKGPVTSEVVDASLTGFRLFCTASAMVPQVARFRFLDFDLELQAQKVWLKGNFSGWKILYDSGQTSRLLAAIAEQNNKRPRGTTPAEVFPVRRR